MGLGSNTCALKVVSPNYAGMCASHPVHAVCRCKNIDLVISGLVARQDALCLPATRKLLTFIILMQLNRAGPPLFSAPADIDVMGLIDTGKQCMSCTQYRDLDTWVRTRVHLRKQ